MSDKGEDEGAGSAAGTPNGISASSGIDRPVSQSPITSSAKYQTFVPKRKLVSTASPFLEELDSSKLSASTDKAGRHRSSSDAEGKHTTVLKTLNVAASLKKEYAQKQRYAFLDEARRKRFLFLKIRQ